MVRQTQTTMSRRPVAFTVAIILAAVVANASQRGSTPDLRLISAAVGPGGTVTEGRFVLSEERSAFSRLDDKELVITFQWEGTPGVHRMVATWRGPDGTLSSSAPIRRTAPVCIDSLKSHLVRRDETQALVETTPLVRGVKDDAPDASVGEALEDGSHQRIGDATPPPGRFHVDVENDRFRTELEIIGTGARARKDRSDLRTGTADDRGRPGHQRHPAKVLTGFESVPQV